MSEEELTEEEQEDYTMILEWDDEKGEPKIVKLNPKALEEVEE